MLTYNDTFLVDSIDTSTLAAIEASATKEVYILLSDVINTIDPDIRDTLIVYKVYQRVAAMQLEAEGMSEKYKTYNDLFKSLLTTVKSGTQDANTTISSITIGRG